MMNELNADLAQEPIFRHLGEEERSHLVSLAVEREIVKGEYLAHYGEAWPYMLFIQSGTISVLKLSPEGRNLGALRLGSGEIFLNPSFFDDGPLPASLEVKETGIVYIWPREKILSILMQNSEVLWDLCLWLANRIRQASEYVEELAFQPVHGRLARLLLDRFEEGDDTHVPREFTLDEMSTMIGTTPVMVCKMLSRFAAGGLVKVSRTQFELLNRSDLEKMAGK
jgi:CRP-like cAMP-binding protein